MKKQAVYYIIFLSFLMTQFNNCSPANISSSSITSLNSSEPLPDKNDPDPNGPDEGTPEPFYKQSFDTGFEGLIPSNSAMIVDNNCYSGNFCLRSNLSPSEEDPLTGKIGDLSLMDMSTMNIKRNTYEEVYLKFWFRFDDVQWDSGAGDNSTDVFAKIYLSKYLDYITPKESSFMVILQGGPDGKVKVINSYEGTDNNELWGDFFQSVYGWEDAAASATRNFYGSTNSSFGSDGLWHSFELHIKYNQSGTGYHLGQIKIDGNAVVNASNTSSDGYFKLPTHFKLESFSLIETDYNYVENAIQRREGEYPVGVQIDELEIYSQRP